MKKKFKYFLYFYSYLKHRIYITFFLSLFVGLLDGIGLALFIPLLKLVANNTSGEILAGDKVSWFVVKILKVEPSLFNILVLIFLFFALKGIAKFFEGYIRVLYQQYFMRKVRVSNIDLLNNLDYEKFARSDVGRIQNTFSGEVQKVNTAFRHYFKSFQYGVLVLVYLLMAIGADPQFSLMVAVGGIFTNFIFKVLYKRTKHLSKKLTSQNHIFQGLLIQQVAFFKYLKTTGLYILYGKKLKNNILGLESLQRRIGIIDSLLAALREPIVVLVILVAIYLQTRFFGEDLGLIILSLLLLYRALTFFMGMQEQWNFFLGTSGSLDNLEEFSKELELGQQGNGIEEFNGFHHKLVLTDVSFGFDQQEVLHEVNLEIHKNETLALIGASGSGKSTLMNIISGLLRPDKGTYEIDHKPLNQFDLNAFKRFIGYVPQDSCVFNDTIYNNVTFWSDKNPENYNRFLSALKEAAIYDFVLNLPAKEETLLGNNGINLSGGQKQRLSIARELFKEVELLLMDEATSALDGETEASIQDNIEKLKGNFTIVVIAHRLATVKNADRIVLLKDGRIKESGSYEHMLESSSDFREMIALQNL